MKRTFQSSAVISAILKRPMKDGHGRGSIFTPFSRAELRASRSRPSKRDAVSALPLASQSEQPSSQKQNTLDAKTPILSSYGSHSNPGSMNDLRSSVLEKTASTLPPDRVPPSLQTSQPFQRGLLPPSDDDDEEYLCTDAAGPPGTLTETSSHTPMSRVEHDSLLKARGDAWKNDSLREARSRERRDTAEKNGLSILKYDKPYFSDIQGGEQAGSGC
jgi:hypothetical protein